MPWVIPSAPRRVMKDPDPPIADPATPDACPQSRASVRDIVEATVATLGEQQVRRALRSLTALQRESIVLAYYEGYVCEEVSEALGIPIGTVRIRMRDGLINMRDCLEADS